ncbi:hypothetical protein LTR70_003435 [Exophiala xenobiotica]|uniref:F-box domain-containing protein n=1 Tax=Lithohypha guttulata TaxID=1690604 RepID=A0ABR0KG06_9EURO|nr:hypothetical protein LTR24_002982 [Lithohypha guttulata]KAK5322973.1 hypothetical protein LTR70_003435 [Exophiala xenobiotica]
MESHPVLVAPELIEMLLYTVHAYGSSALAACLRVCKEWRAIGEPILWRHIYLELEKFETFISAVSSAGLKRVHSMTLHFNQLDIWKDYKIPSVKVAAHLLMPLLWNMPNLVSLSCRFTPHEDTLSAAASLLSKLPARVRNLELLSCRQPYWARTTRAGLVPNCTTHRPDFQSVVYSGIPRPFHDAFYNSQVRNSLLLRKARVVVIGQRFVTWEETEDAFGYLYTISCIDDITTVYPFAKFCGTRGIGGIGDLEAEEGTQSEDDSQVDEGKWMRYSIPSNGQEVDIIDARNMLNLPKHQLEMLEGPSWLQLGHGARLPRAIRREQEYDWRYTTPLVTLIDNAMKARKKYRPGAALWYWEDRVGRKLLHVQTHKGHELPDYPRRERPQEEQDMDPCSIPMLQLEGLPSKF